jgi:hypothetical protein
VIDIAHHSETDEILVLYRPLYEVKPTSCIYGKDIIARPLINWYDTIEKDGLKVERFIEVK